MTAGLGNFEPDALNSAAVTESKRSSTPDSMVDGQGAHALDELP